MFDAALSAEDNLYAIAEEFNKTSSKIFELVHAVPEMRSDIKGTLEAKLQDHISVIQNLISQIQETW